jgi:hypothetical protein
VTNLPSKQFRLFPEGCDQPMSAALGVPGALDEILRHGIFDQIHDAALTGGRS